MRTFPGHSMSNVSGPFCKQFFGSYWNQFSSSYRENIFRYLLQEMFWGSTVSNTTGTFSAVLSAKFQGYTISSFHPRPWEISSGRTVSTTMRIVSGPNVSHFVVWTVSPFSSPHCKQFFQGLLEDYFLRSDCEKFPDRTLTKSFWSAFRGDGHRAVL